MSITFEGPAVFVSDMTAARTFYEQVLGQSVLFAVGDQYAAFQGGFSLWQHQSAEETVHGRKPTGAPTPQGRENFELYFETPDLPAAWERTRAACCEPIHSIREMAWGQRCFRIRDTDGHIVEVGEPMPLVIKRFLDEGMAPEAVAERTMAPIEMVRAMCGDKNNS